MVIVTCEKAGDLLLGEYLDVSVTVLDQCLQVRHLVVVGRHVDCLMKCSQAILRGISRLLVEVLVTALGHDDFASVRVDTYL